MPEPLFPSRGKIPKNFKIGFSPSTHKKIVCFDQSPLKMMKNKMLFYLLFHFKSSFRTQDIQIFVWTFWSCRKNGLIRNIRLISKLMTSQLD